MDKEQLETNIAALELLVNETTDKSVDFKAQLEQAKKDLADVNKPVLTALQLDDIQEAIEAGIENFDFSDNDNYSIEYGIDYDGKVHCESLELSDTYQLTEMITKKVHALFVEAEELDTTEVDNHA
jgi:hypothetical protein